MMNETIIGVFSCYSITWILIAASMLRFREYRNFLSFLIIGSRLLVLFVPLFLVFYLMEIDALKIFAMYMGIVVIFSGFPFNLLPPMLSRVAFYKGQPQTQGQPKGSNAKDKD